MAFWQNSTVLYNNRMSRSCISNPELHFQSWAAFPTRPCVLCRAEIQNWAKNFSRIAPCLTFSKGLGQPGSVFCECVLPWCWWADTCSASSSLNRWCDPASMCHVRGTTCQETQSRGNVEGSKVLWSQGLAGAQHWWWTWVRCEQGQGQSSQAGNGDGAEEFAAAVTFPLPLPQHGLVTCTEHCTSSCLHGQRELETDSFLQDTRSDCSGRLENTDISHFSCKELRRDIWKENLTKSQLIWIYCTRIYIIFDEKLSLKFRIYNSKNGIQIDYFNTIAQRSNLTTGLNFKLRLLNSNLKKGSQNQQHWVLDVINIDTKISCFFFADLRLIH